MMKRREAMLKARGISEAILLAVIQQGKGKPTYTLTHDQMAELSAAALDVTEYLCVPRSE
jgi:phosphopantetheinyl transferase